MSERYCAKCQFLIIPKTNPEDLMAQANGYCSTVCRKLWIQEKEYHLEREANHANH